MEDPKDGAKGEDPASAEGSAFEALERDFQQVLQELVGDKSLERFRTEYEKLHRALKKSHESEKRLVKKARELNSEIVQNASKVQTALKLSQEDQATVASLKREIEKAWKMVDAAHDKEARAKEAIASLKGEITNLSKLVEQGAGLSIGQESTVNELMRVKNDLMRERDNAIAQVGVLRVEIDDYVKRIGVMETDHTAQREAIEAFRNLIAQKRADAERDAARKAKMEAELLSLQKGLEDKQAELRERAESLSATNESILKLEHQLRDERQRTDKASKEVDGLHAKGLKQQAQHEEHTFTAAQLVKEGAERSVELRLREDEIAGHKREIARLTATVEATAEKAAAIEARRDAVEAESLGHKKTLNELDARLAEAKRLHDVDRRRKEHATRERELLIKGVLKAQGLTAKQADVVRVHENQRKNLEQEIGGFKGEAYRQRKTILSLEKERERLLGEARDAGARHAQAAEELRTREASALALQRRIADVDNKLKQQQNLYEAVRADRNLYNKSLLDARDEIGEMRRKFKIMNHQIEQLKEEIHSKDQSLVREHFEHMKVVKEKEALKDEVGRVRKQTTQADETMATYKAELTKLAAVVAEADTEGARQAKEKELVVNERDLLGMQLIRRTEELSLLYEKIRVHDSMLRKGEEQFGNVTGAVGALQQRLHAVHAEVSALKSSVTNSDSIRNEVYHLARELMHERAKVKGLESELAYPLNVHRWRKLEGSDPAAYEMVQKIQVLQKRLIGKSAEAAAKADELQHKDKLYAELKTILARQPGPEIAEKLALYKHSLKEKEQQTEQMSAELAMYHAQVADYKAEIDRVVRELHDVQRKFFEQKKKEHAHRESVRADRTRRAPIEATIAEARASIPRFTGGGFSLSRRAS